MKIGDLFLKPVERHIEGVIKADDQRHLLTEVEEFVITKEESLKECQEWEREIVLPLAQQRIELDLDEGVKVNYQKFPGLLAKIPGLDKKKED